MSALDDWCDPYGCQDLSLAEDVISELLQQVASLEAERDAAFNKGMERAAEIAINLFAGRDDFKKEYDAGFDIEDAIRKEIT